MGIVRQRGNTLCRSGLSIRGGEGLPDLNTKLQRPDAQPIVVPHLALPRHGNLIDKGSVAAAQVTDYHLARPDQEGCVTPADGQALGPQIAGLIPPNRKMGMRNQDLLALMHAS